MEKIIVHYIVIAYSLTIKLNSLILVEQQAINFFEAPTRRPRLVRRVIFFSFMNESKVRKENRRIKSKNYASFLYPRTRYIFLISPGGIEDEISKVFADHFSFS